MASEPIALVGLDIMHLGHRPGDTPNSKPDEWAFSGLSLLSNDEDDRFFADFEPHFTLSEWDRIHRWHDTDTKYLILVPGT